MMTDALVPWSYNYFFPLVTTHFASGQWFLTAIWERYHAQLPEHPADDDMLVRIMMDMREGAARWVFFTQGRGGTWVGWDSGLFDTIGNTLIPWLGGHVVLVALAATLVGGLLWYRRRRSSRGYKPLVADIA